ncbi:DUF2264 domain-containing protein [Streptomyces sp. NBC_01198]|nr:DUF2264 domain-containing protein [Streptomyces sp. NBC_01198]
MSPERRRPCDCPPPTTDSRPTRAGPAATGKRWPTGSFPPGEHTSDSGRWSDGLEGFARSFLPAAFRLGAAGPPQDGPGDPAGPSRRAELADWYARGIAHGTDPAAADRWPTLREKGQAKVECASIALALHLTRPLIWDRLDDAVRARTVAWMAGMIGAGTPRNNWIWFQNITEAFLRSVGGPWSRADLDRNLELTESWYAGDGWYADGEFGGGLRDFDYYNGWALLFYPLWYCLISGPDTEPGLRDRYAARLARYLSDAQHLVGADGAPLFHGRSLTYRFAMLAPFWTGALFDATPPAPGLTRRLGSGVLRHFVRAGAVDDRGLLSLGWHRSFPAIRQTYSGTGSPYWASKGFAGLLLPPGHPVWTEPEQPLAVERADVQRTLAVPGWLVSGTVADGVVRVVNHGGDHARPGRAALDEPCYDRYGTVAAPDHGAPDGAAPLDSHVALLTPDGRASVRRPNERLFIGGRVAVSRHRAHWPLEPAVHGGPPRTRLGPVLTTGSVLRGAVEVRIVRVDPVPLPRASSPEGLLGAEACGLPDGEAPHPGPWRLRIAGAALAAAGRTAWWPGSAPTRAAVETAEEMVSAVVLLGGRAPAGRFETGVSRLREANPFGRRSASPWVRTVAPVAAGEIHAVAVVLGKAAEGAAAVRLTVTRAGGGGDAVTVTWPDGEQDLVPMQGPPPP